jgi:hypothetical protein
MMPNELRAEAAMVDAEEGTDCTTRAALLRGAAEEIERLRAQLHTARGLLDTAIDARESIGPCTNLSHDCSIWLPPAWYDKAREVVEGKP